MARRPAAATSSPWRPSTSCWSTTAPAPFPCPRCRCSACSPAPAASPASPTSARCGPTAPTSSPPWPRACAASAPSTGAWWTSWPPAPGWPRRPENGPRSWLPPLERELAADRIEYPNLTVELDRSLGVATFTLRGPGGDPAAIEALGAGWWPLAVARELDDAILLLRFNEPEIGTWVLRSRGDPEAVAAFDRVLLAHANHWLVREVILHLKRTLKRLELSARSLIALVEPGSCFAGSLLELVLAADRAFMLEGEQEGVDQPPATLRLDPMNLGPLPCSNGLTRLQRRFLGHPEALEAVTARLDEPLEAAEAEALGLVTFIYDDIDFEDEVRLAIEERASLSPDALTGMESNLRCGGPETMETKIFGRLTAWQNWVFQRPNAAGEDGALRRFGTGQRPRFDRKRV